MAKRSYLTRRDFVRYASTGAASAYLLGCRATQPETAVRRPAPRPGQIGYEPELIDRDTFRRLADAALEASTADDTVLSLSDKVVGTTQFYGDEIIEHGETPYRGLIVSVAFAGKERAKKRVDDLSEAGVADAVAQAVKVAEQAPEDPQYLPALPPQIYPILPTWRQETAVDPERHLAEARRMIALGKAEGSRIGGDVETTASADGVAASTGLFAYERCTRADFNVDVTANGGHGWAANANRSIDDLNVESHIRMAIETAKRSASRRDISLGRQTAILAPAAVADLLWTFLRSLTASEYYEGTSPLSGRLGERIFDDRLTLRNRPDHPALLGHGFTHDGLPTNYKKWIDGGVLRELDYDRLTAKKHGVEPSYGLDAPELSGACPDVASLNDLIASTERAILITHNRYASIMDYQDLSLAGLTDGGTLLIEDGQIAGRIGGIPWSDNSLEVFNRIDALTPPAEAVGVGRTKTLVPAMRIRDFNFSA